MGGHILHPDKTLPYISLLPKNTQNENFHLYKNNRQIENITDANREIYIHTTNPNRNKLSHFQKGVNTKWYSYHHNCH